MVIIRLLLLHKAYIDANESEKEEYTNNSI